MKAVIVFESMFGNTRQVARAIADGISEFGEAQVVCVVDGPPRPDDEIDLLVVGGPTHAWSMSRPSTRKSAPSYADKPGQDLTLEPGAATGPGVREWLAQLPRRGVDAAAFDTRLDKPPMITGRASKAIGRALTKRGARLVARPQSFLVDNKNHLLPHELDRARDWGREVAAKVGVLRTR